MKTFKKVILLTLVAITFTGAGAITALAATGWGGSQAYENTVNTFSQIVTRGKELKSERDAANQSNEQLKNTVKDKENVIKDKDNQINAKQQEIDSLKKNDKSKELEQAVKDMQSVDQKAKDILNELK